MAAPHVALSSEPAFSMLVLGCGGGPSEDDLSAFWIKPAGASWMDGFTSVDGGSCLGALRRLLQLYPQSFTKEHGWALPKENGGSALANAGTIFQALTSFLITHAHWDHIAGLVLSSQSVSPSNPKYIYGTPTTLSHLSSFAMNGHLWPSLGSYSSPDTPSTSTTPYIYRNVCEKSQWVYPSKGLRAKAMPISHGEGEGKATGGKGKERFASTAYLMEVIEDEMPQGTNGHGSAKGGRMAHPRSCMIFGDIEADSVSGETYNRDIWTMISPRIAEGSMTSIFIECSYSSERAPERLYGHLSPVYIFEELRVLAGLIPSAVGADEGDLRGRLSGLTLGIMHVKEATSVDTLPLPPTASAHAMHTSARRAYPSLQGPTDSLQVSASQADAVKIGTSGEKETPLKKRRKPSAENELEQVAPTRRRTRSTATKEAQELSSVGQCRIDPPPPPLPNGLVTDTYASMQENENSQRVFPESIKARIQAELLAFEEKEGLGVKFLMLEQGMRIAF